MKQIKELLTKELIDNIKKPEATWGFRNRDNKPDPPNARMLNRIYVQWDEIIDLKVLQSWGITPEDILEYWEEERAEYDGFSNDYEPYKKGDFYKTDEHILEHNATMIASGSLFYEFLDEIMPYTVVVEKDGYSFDTQWGDDPVPLDIALEIIKHHIPEGSVNPGNYIEFNTQGGLRVFKEEWFIELWKNKQQQQEGETK